MSAVPKQQALGRHLLVECYECDPEVLNDSEVIEREMAEAARRTGATIVATNFHNFSPHGVSGVVVIAESHLAIHTWPEYGYAAVDLFTCGEECDPEPGFEHLKRALKAQRTVVTKMLRGCLNTQGKPLHHKPVEVGAAAGAADT